MTELSRGGFRAAISDLALIYGAAMEAAPAELPSRRAIMERHAVNPGFRALTVTDGRSGPAVAFCYGFRGLPGQWWHDVVRSGILAAAGLPAARHWLDDVLEVAEVHVHPDYQARGIGRRMLLTLCRGRAESTALLSTRDAPTPAKRLYSSLGFAELLSDFTFPGGGPPYAIMGAALPLQAGASAVT